MTLKCPLLSCLLLRMLQCVGETVSLRFIYFLNRQKSEASTHIQYCIKYQCSKQSKLMCKWNIFRYSEIIRPEKNLQFPVPLVPCAHRNQIQPANTEEMMLKALSLFHFQVWRQHKYDLCPGILVGTEELYYSCYDLFQYDEERHWLVLPSNEWVLNHHCHG